MITLFYLLLFEILFLHLYIVSLKMKKKRMVNYKKIKRDILRRDMGLDTRFTTKVGKDKKKYNRNQEKRKNYD